LQDVPVVLTGATVVVGNGRILTQATVVMRAGRIEAAGPGVPVPAAINRLKMIKHQMYGRAGFELLRAHVLPYSPAVVAGPPHDLHQNCGRAHFYFALTSSFPQSSFPTSPFPPLDSFEIMRYVSTEMRL
jgi:hypothetical protein